MFILNSSYGGTAMFAKGQKAESDIDLWHKQIGHINYQWLQDVQLKHVVFRLPKFSGRKAQFVKPASLGSNTDFPSFPSSTGPRR